MLARFITMLSRDGCMDEDWHTTLHPATTISKQRHERALWDVHDIPQT